MFKVDTIKTELIALVGWHQNPDPNGEQLVALTTSLSGLYFNDEHPMLTLENLYSISPDSSQYVYDAFQPAKTNYAVGDIVIEAGVLYRRILVHAAAQPVSDPIYWELFTDFTRWLKEKTESGIIQAVNDWYSRKSKLLTASNLLKANNIFVRDYNTATDEATKVIYKIAPRDGLDADIISLDLHFEDTQIITFNLYEIGNTNAVQTKAVTIAAAGVEQKETFDWNIKGKGAYYLEYTYTGNAISYFDIKFTSSKYVAIANVSTTDVIANLWNSINGIASNYGININLSVECDYTDFIVDQKDLFKIVIAKKVGMNLLRELIYNPNSLVTRNGRNVDDKQLLYEIDGDSQSTPGNNRSLKEQYDLAINAIQFDTTNINKVCMPCKRRGVRYGTIR